MSSRHAIRRQPCPVIRRRRLVVSDLLTGQYNNPVRVIAFNTVEAWARDVSEDVTREVARRAVEEGRSLDAGARRFAARYVEERALPAKTDA